MLSAQMLSAALVQEPLAVQEPPRRLALMGW
jgi:hypothetical protein